MREKKSSVTAAVLRLGRREALSAPPQLCRRYVDLETPLLHVQDDGISVVEKRDGAAGGRLGSDVENDRPEGSTAHPGVGHAHHVRHARAKQLLRDRNLTPLGHARAALGARVSEDEHGFGTHLERRVVDPVLDVVHVLEDDRRPAVAEQLGRGCAALDPTFRGKRLRDGRDDIPVRRADAR